MTSTKKFALLIIVISLVVLVYLIATGNEHFFNELSATWDLLRCKLIPCFMSQEEFNARYF